MMEMAKSGGMPNLFDLVEARSSAIETASNDSRFAALHALSLCNDEGADDARVSPCADEIEPQISVCADEVEPQRPQGLAGLSVCADELEDVSRQ